MTIKSEWQITEVGQTLAQIIKCRLPIEYSTIKIGPNLSMKSRLIPATKSRSRSLSCTQITTKQCKLAQRSYYVSGFIFSPVAKCFIIPQQEILFVINMTHTLFYTDITQCKCNKTYRIPARSIWFCASQSDHGIETRVTGVTCISCVESSNNKFDLNPRSCLAS